MHKIGCGMMVLLVLVCFSSGYSALPEPGPENHGLRLRLSITSEGSKTEDIHTVQLNLINTGKNSITLTAKWLYEQNTGDYGEYLKSEVMLISFPEVVLAAAQTAGSLRSSPQPKQVLKSGESLMVKWQVIGPHLKPQGYYNCPTFPADGLYTIHAEFTTTIENEQDILLISNPQQVSIGKSTQMPKYATARITFSDPAAKTAGINLGALQNIEVGDTFFIKYTAEAGWRLRISAVHLTYSEGIVEPIANPSESNTPLFPDLNWVARLMSKEELQQKK